jgi:signal transduction histidine kinase
MESVAPLVTGIAALALGTTAVVGGERKRLPPSLTADYVTLTGTCAITYLSLFLSDKVDPNQRFFDITMFAGLALTGPALFTFTRDFLQRHERRGLGPLPPLWAIGVALFGLAIPFAHTIWMVMLASAWVLICVGLSLQLMYFAARNAEATIEQGRLRTLAVFSSVVAALVSAEAIVRLLVNSPDTVPLLPPAGTLSVPVYLFFVFESLRLGRLLDAREIVSQGSVFGILAAGLALVYPLLVDWLGDDVHPVTRMVNTLLAAVVILALHDPLRQLLRRLFLPRVLRRSNALRAVLAEMGYRLPALVDPHRIAGQAVRAFRKAGYLEQVAIYLWDDRSEAFRLGAALKAEPSSPLPETVALEPTSEVLAAQRGSVDRNRIARSVENSAVTFLGHLLDSLSAEILIPFKSGGHVAGWMAIAREEDAPSWSTGELTLLEEAGERIAVALDSTRVLKGLRERDRLAGLGRIAAGLAHEIRNPLGAIKGAAQLLQSAELQDDEDREHLDIVVEETDRLGVIVGQFLDYARPLRVDAALLRLDNWTRQIGTLIRAAGLPEGVELVISSPPEDTTVVADGEKLKQVVLNLVRNGLEALDGEGTIGFGARYGAPGLPEPPGRPHGWRMQRGRLPTGQAQWVEIWVDDNGPGIGSEHRESLFLPFFTTKANGTGLGLPVCERLVLDMHGQIELSTAPQKGTRFMVRVPEGGTSTISSDGVALLTSS